MAFSDDELTKMLEDMKEIRDKQEITEVLYKYCRAMDRVDDSLSQTIYHADGWADYDENLFRGPASDFMAMAHAGHPKHFEATQHMVSNILIEINGDRAVSEAQICATFRFREADAEAGNRTRQSWGRYIDRWERREGRWAIVYRRYLRTTDEMRSRTISDHSPSGRQDRSDESYDAFAWLRQS